MTRAEPALDRPRKGFAPGRAWGGGGKATHGIIFAELKKYVVARLGGQAWNDLLEAAGLGQRIYLPSEAYPDEELVALVSTASRITGKPAQALLEDYGEFIAGDLVTLYRAQIDPAWRTLDLIEHTEQLIHRQVRLKIPGARPPELEALREGPDKVRLVYRSRRQLCGVAKGIARGIARHYQEDVTVTEDQCMLRGDKTCDILVARALNPSPARDPWPKALQRNP